MKPRRSIASPGPRKLYARGFSELLRATQDIVMLFQSDGRIVEANPAAERAYQWSRDELVGRSIKDLRATETWADLPEQLSLAAELGVRFQTTHCRKNGEQFPVEVTSRSLRQGREVLLLSIIRDLSSQQSRDSGHAQELVRELRAANTQLLHEVSHVRQLEHSLRRTQQELDSVFQHADQGFILADLSGCMLQVNRRLAEMLGYAEAELVGRHFSEITFPEDTTKDLELFLQLAAGRRESYQLEKRYLHRDGHPVLCLLTARSIRDEHGVVRYLLCQIRDITAGRQFSADLYASLVRHSDNIIYVCSPEGIILSWNPAGERILGYSQQDVLGRHVSLLYPDRSGPTGSLIDQLPASASPLQQAVQRKAKSGQLVDLLITVSPIKDSAEQLVGTATIARDITEQVARDRELARLDRLALVGEMAASIGHELRNPMTTVRGYLQLLSRKPALTAYRDQMQLMMDELDRMNEIITEFLALARDKRVELAWEDLNRVVTALLPLVTAEGMLQGKLVRCELGELPPLLLDPKEIRQLLLHLVQNGLDAIQSGQAVTIRTSRLPDRVLLEVADQGSGIAPEHLAKLGTPFFTTKPGGTGLGLSLCYSIAARHGASVNVTTDSGGTAFRILFPSLEQQPKGNC